MVEREEQSVSGWALSARMERSWFDMVLALDCSLFRPPGSVSLGYSTLYYFSSWVYFVTFYYVAEH